MLRVITAASETLREHPGAIFVKADFAGDGGERDAGPFRGAEQSVRTLHRLQGRLVPLGQAVARAFDEMLPGDRRKPL